MWSTLENIAIRESLPAPLEAGQSIHGILISGQLNKGCHNLYYLGHRRSIPYQIKQFYSISTDSFLCWQNEARFISMPQTSRYSWPCEEWRGGLIAPFPSGMSLAKWLTTEKLSINEKLKTAAMLAQKIASLHASNIFHRALSPSCIYINDDTVSINNFGHARYKFWDDFWTDSLMSPSDKAYVSPECLKGYCGDDRSDVYSFGAILHLIISNKPVFSSLKLILRTTFPELIVPNTLTATNDIPTRICNLTSACLSPSPANRPLMNEAVTVLSEFCAQPLIEIEKIPIPNNEFKPKRKKIMVFIKNDNRAVSLFDFVLQKANKTPSAFLFVGLIPCNLPSGDAERFKGSLFKKLGQGLMRCREEKLLWSLRVLENTDPAKAAVELIRQYQPDQVLVGRSAKNTKNIFRKNFCTILEAEDVRVESIP